MTTETVYALVYTVFSTMFYAGPVHNTCVMFFLYHPAEVYGVVYHSVAACAGRVGLLNLRRHIGRIRREPPVIPLPFPHHTLYASARHGNFLQQTKLSVSAPFRLGNRTDFWTMKR